MPESPRQDGAAAVNTEHRRPTKARGQESFGTEQTEYAGADRRRTRPPDVDTALPESTN